MKTVCVLKSWLECLNICHSIVSFVDFASKTSSIQTSSIIHNSYTEAPIFVYGHPASSSTCLFCASFRCFSWSLQTLVISPGCHQNRTQNQSLASLYLMVVLSWLWLIYDRKLIYKLLKRCSTYGKNHTTLGRHKLSRTLRFLDFWPRPSASFKNIESTSVLKIYLYRPRAVLYSTGIRSAALDIHVLRPKRKSCCTTHQCRRSWNNCRICCLILLIYRRPSQSPFKTAGGPV